MEAITCLLQNWHFSWWAKINGTQRRALVSPWRMHCINSGGTFLGWSDIEQRKNQVHSLIAIVELCEAGRQAGRQPASQPASQLVNQSVNRKFHLINCFVANFWGSIWKLLGLVLPAISSCKVNLIRGQPPQSLMSEPLLWFMMI